jgi:CheY-like chemotaxis protein
MAADPERRVDLLLTDVIMPGMFGTEVAARIRDIRPAAPVLLMSGYAQPVLDSHGMAAQEFDLVEKPFTAATLLAPGPAGHHQGEMSPGPRHAAVTRPRPAPFLIWSAARQAAGDHRSQRLIKLIAGAL